MQFNARTIELLENFSRINPSLYFRKGNQILTIAPTKNVLARATFDQEFPFDFAIYDLNKFLGVMSLFKEPLIEFSEKQAIISKDNQKVHYTFADPEAIVSPPSDKKIVHGDPLVKFTMTADMLKSVKAAADILRVPEIAIKANGKNISICAYDVKNPTSDNYAIEIAETDKKFSAVFKKDTLQFISKDYDVEIASTGPSYFKSDYIEYWVMIDKNASSFGE